MGEINIQGGSKFVFFKKTRLTHESEDCHRVLLVDTCGSPGLANCIEADCKVPGTEDVSRSLPEESVQDSIVLKPPLVSAHMLPMYSMYSIPKYPHTYRVHT